MSDFWLVWFKRIFDGCYYFYIKLINIFEKKGFLKNNFFKNKGKYFNFKVRILGFFFYLIIFYGLKI